TIHEGRVGVVAEDKPNARGVPAVEKRGQREVRVATQQDVAEARPATDLDRLVERHGGAFMGRAVAATVDDEERLTGIGNEISRGRSPHTPLYDRSIPSLHLPVVGTIEPSASMRAVSAVRVRLRCQTSARAWLMRAWIVPGAVVSRARARPEHE